MIGPQRGRHVTSLMRSCGHQGIKLMKIFVCTYMEGFDFSLWRTCRLDNILSEARSVGRLRDERTDRDAINPGSRCTRASWDQNTTRFIFSHGKCLRVNAFFFCRVWETSVWGCGEREGSQLATTPLYLL